MLTRLTPLVFAGLFVAPLLADEPKRPAPTIAKLPSGFDADKMADPKEAAKAAEWLEKEYPETPRPEGVQMLIAILRGSQLNGSDGWFHPAQTRYTWPWLAKQHGIEAKGGGVPKKLFRGTEAQFDRLLVHPFDERRDAILDDEAAF